MSEDRLGKARRGHPPATGEPGSGDPLERVTVSLTARSSSALRRAAELTGDTMTDTINRALQVYAFLQQAPAHGTGPYGPFKAKADAKADAAALYAACPVPAGRDAPVAILLDALSDAGVVIGGFDREVLSHFALVASHEAVASLAGLIRRAASAARP